MSRNPKPLTFLGQTFADQQSLRLAYPAYGRYDRLIRAGADTPHKVELALYAERKPHRSGMKMQAFSRKRKQA